MVKTTALVIVMFPLIVPIWKEKPFDSANVKRPDLPTFLDDRQVKKQGELFSQIPDPRIKSKIPDTLAQANNATAVKIMENLAAKEKSPRILADILRGLYQYKGKASISNAQAMKNMMSSENAMVRAYASALYLDKTKDLREILALLTNETSDFVVSFLLDEVNEQKGKCPPESAAGLIKAKNPVARLAGFYLLALVSPNPDADAILIRTANSKDVSKKIALAQGLFLRKTGAVKLLSTLSEDPNSTVRSIIASAPVDSNRITYALKLANDTDWSVRQAICDSLGTFQSPSSIETLLKAIGDENELVRTAAEHSLLKLKLNEESVAKIQDALNNPNKMNSAITILGALDVTSAGAKILEILKTVKSPETTRRAIKALGQLNNKAACGAIMDHSSDKDVNVRRAVAVALGQLKVEESYDIIVEMVGDDQTSVALDAIKAMGKIGAPKFSQKLYAIIKDTSESSSPESRSYACWALARLDDKPSKRVINQLKKICLKKVISVMGEKMYDSDFVRISACLALVDMASKAPSVKSSAAEVVEKLKSPPMFNPDFNNPTLRDYARQAELYMNGKSIEEQEAKTITPMFVVRPVIKEAKDQQTSSPF